MAMAAVSRSILTINSGSSSLKVSLFRADGSRRDWHHKQTDPSHRHNQTEAFDALLEDLGGEMPDAIGHRFVYGGEVIDSARVLDAVEIERLRGLIPLAPLHLPGNLLGGNCAGHAQR
ncbi:MAG: hypothetical protein ACOH1Q_10450 [Thiobacillus sp.]